MSRSTRLARYHGEERVSGYPAPRIRSTIEEKPLGPTRLPPLITYTRALGADAKAVLVSTSGAGMLAAGAGVFGSGAGTVAGGVEGTAGGAVGRNSGLMGSGEGIVVTGAGGTSETAGSCFETGTTLPRS